MRRSSFASAALFVLQKEMIKPALRVKGDSGSSLRRRGRFFKAENKPALCAVEKNITSAKLPLS